MKYGNNAVDIFNVVLKRGKRIFFTFYLAFEVKTHRLFHTYVYMCNDLSARRLTYFYTFICLIVCVSDCRLKPHLVYPLTYVNVSEACRKI